MELVQLSFDVFCTDAVAVLTCLRHGFSAVTDAWRHMILVLLSA